VCQKVFGEKLRTRPPSPTPPQIVFDLQLSEWEVPCPEIRAPVLKGLKVIIIYTIM